MAKLCPKGKAAAKRKFKVYPSAYANAYASKICAGKIKDPSGTKRKDFKGPKPTDRYGQQMKPKPIRPGKKDGGRAKKFPDLSGDGKVTKKDVLMGRGIIPKKLKNLKPGAVDTAKKIIKKGKK